MLLNIPVYQGAPRSFLMQLRRRLIISLSVLVVCFLLTSVLSIFVSLQQQQLGNQKVTIHNAENNLLTSMLDQETGLRGYISTANTSLLDPYNSAQPTYTIALEQLKLVTTSTSFTATTAALQQFEKSVATWSTNYADIQLTNMRAGNRTAAQASLTQGKALFDVLRASFNNLQNVSDNDITALQVRVNIVTFSSLGAALLATILVMIWLWRTFGLFTRIQRHHLDALKETSAAFGSGDLQVRVQKGPDEEFNELGQIFNAMAGTLLEQQQGLKDRDILENVSELNATLTESLDLPMLVQQLFQRILNALDLQICALYLFQPETSRLTHFASRGIDAEALQERFALGEGLVGRVAEDRELLMTTQQNAETDAFALRTLLGTALPASMYHLPLVHGNDLLGVLVVGSLYPMREQTRNVLNVIRSNLASAIHNAQSYEQIQQQAQELAKRSRQQEESNQVLRQQRDELSILNNALQEANQVRSQFLSTMSHELRTPLTSIIGFGQMLQRSTTQSALTTRQQQNVERILRNAQHLLSLINDVLDLSKIEAGHMDVSTSEIDLPTFLTDLVEETRSIAIAHQLDLRLEMQEGLPKLETDERKVRQIILNLLSNALKFTEQGFVSVQVTSQKFSTEQQETGEQIIIAIQDSGVGIPVEQQSHIFDAFYQVDSSNSRSFGGTGLGLSIVRELTELLGGKIEFESQPGQGSIFRLILPQRPREQRLLHQFRLHTTSEGNNNLPNTPASFPHVSLDAVATLQLQQGVENAPLVIAIDDNPDTLQLIAQALEPSPYRLVGIQDSTQALAAIEELKPSLITLDVMMPKINGWQILHSLKSNPNTASIPVILLTVLEDRSAGYVLGADEYLVKPVARETLLSVLQQLLSQQSTEMQPTEGHPSQPLPTRQYQENSKSIILLHQIQDIPGLLTRLINEAGYRVQPVPQEQDIIRLIEKAHPNLLMLLVKLEVNSTVVEGDMPGDTSTTSGHELEETENPPSSD